MCTCSLFLLYSTLNNCLLMTLAVQHHHQNQLQMPVISQRHLGVVYNTLISQGDVRGLDEFQVKDIYTEMVSYIWLFEPRYIEQAIAHHRSQSDLCEMMKHAPLITSTIPLPPTCQEMPISHSFERTWWQEHNSDPSSSFKHRFLDTLTFPPCLSGGNQTLLPPLAKERIHPMDIVSFNKAWLFDKLVSIAISDIPPYLHHLEMVMHGHLEPPPRSQVKEYAVYMWPTNGPYDKLIQLIAKWVMEDGGPSYWNLIWTGLVIYMDSHYVIPEFSIVAKGVVGEFLLAAYLLLCMARLKAPAKKKLIIKLPPVAEPALVVNSSSVNSGQKSLKCKKATVASAGEECSKTADEPEIRTSKRQWKPTEKARTSVAATTTVGVGPKSSTTARLTSCHFSTPEMNPPTHTTPANTLLASLSMLNTNTRSNLAVPSAPIRTNGDGSDGDGDEGNGDEGDSDKGDGDKGDSDKGDSDKGDGDKGDGDKGDGDEGNSDEVGSDDKDGGHSPNSVQFHEFQPSTSSQRPQKGKPDYPSADTHSLGDTQPQTKRNQNHTHSLNGNKSPIPDMSPQSPQFGTLSPLKFAAAWDNSMPHPSSNILSLSDEDSDEIIHHLPDTFGSHGVLRQNRSPLSGVSVHKVEEPPMVANSKKHGLVSNTATHIANAAPDDVNNCLDPDFWPDNPSISSSLPFFDGPVPEADLGVLAEKTRYPRLKLLMVTEVKLINHAVVDKEKGQHEKNAFNGWSQSYMKEAPNPLQGEVGHRKQSDYMREVITPAWYAFKREHEAIGDLDEQLSCLQAEMVMVEIDDLKQASQGAGLSRLMAAEQDGMAKTIAMAGAHTIILMFWTSINNPLGNIIWQFYIFVNNETIRLQQVELNPELAQAKAASSKHLRALFEPFVSLEEWFPWQSLADLLYGHQLEIINWGMVPGFANLDRDASNSVISWRLLCSKFHKAPSNIIIGNMKMSLAGQASVPIMTDCNGKVLMWVRSSQRYLEDIEDVQDPAIAGTRKGKCPIPGKPEGRSKKCSRAAVAAAAPIAAHSTTSVDVPLVTGDTETEATTAISTCNITAPGLLITSGIEANPAAADALLTTCNDVVALPQVTSPVPPQDHSILLSQLKAVLPYSYGNPMLPYQGMQHPDPLGLSSFEGQRLNPNSYGSSQQNVDFHDFSAASQAGPDIWRLPTGPNFPP
ncbi:hypothetical protein BS47DRAFT_1365465 [Hydnum rufescens UP504]|uniref:Uncharacterized protein n=1 Tax=Hydnum rufescens UP504 TaxID=1448309 RepID=A0A9P6ANN7_9AGAM|nr:hypothetical protein BS47DRAFT_1365465 [Hydnum rufescens UP504]